MGYCIAPPTLMAAFRKVHQFNVFTCNSPMQHGIAAFLTEKNQYLELGKFLQQKRDYFQQLMQATPFVPLPSYGSYFQLYSYENISQQSELEFATALTEKAGVATIPVSAFYKTPTNNQVLRFCFAKKEETLEAAVERLVKWFAV
jgi:methionine aminotransferase